MKKQTKFTKAGALLLAFVMILGAFITNVSQALAANPNVTIDENEDGSLTIYKLDLIGLTQTEYDDVLLNGGSASDYYYSDPANGGDGKYYKYLDGAEYTIYYVGEIVQSVDANTGEVTVKYQDVYDSSDIDLSDLDSYLAGITLSNYTSYVGETGDLSVPFATGTVVFDSLSLGLYYVQETGTPDGYAVANNFFVQIPMTTTDSDGDDYWEYDVVAYPKNGDNGDLEKEITSGTITDDKGTTTTNDDVETASLGSTVTYKITATTPSNLVTYKTDGTTVDTVNYENFWITDKANLYLTVDTSTTSTTPLTVTAKDSNGVTISLTEGVHYTIEQALNADPESDGTYNNYTYVKFTEEGLKQLGNNAVVTVEYYATIAADVDAALLVEIDNEAYLQYKVDGTDTIGPKDEETVYTYSYSAQKIDGSTPAEALEGAKFVIAQYLDSNGDPATSTTGTLNYLTYSSTSGWGYTTDIDQAYEVTSSDGTNASEDGYYYEDGLFAFRGLALGDYLLIETEAPDGYTLLKDPIAITVNATTTDTANSKDGSTGKYDEYTIQIINNKNSIIPLPTTGGSGIYLFLLIGAALMGTATVIYVKSRKSNKAAQ